MTTELINSGPDSLLAAPPRRVRLLGDDFYVLAVTSGRGCEEEAQCGSRVAHGDVVAATPPSRFARGLF